MCKGENLCIYKTKLIITSIKIIVLFIEIFGLRFNRKRTIILIIFFFFLSINLSPLMINIILIKNQLTIKKEKCLVIILLIIDIIIGFLNVALMIIIGVYEESNTIPCINNIYFFYVPHSIFVCVDFFIFIFDIIILVQLKPRENNPLNTMSSANINDEKLFIFEISNMKKEILISESKTINELISEFKKENKSKKNNLRFFWNNNEIQTNNNIISISTYFNNSNNIIIKVADESKNKTFIFEINKNSKIEISICIYETIEKLISKYCDIILIPKKNMELFFKNKKIVVDQFLSIENYFQKSLNNNKIIIKVKLIQNFIFQETPQLTKIFSINIDKPTNELFSKFIQYY